MAHPVAGQRIRARFERQLAASGLPPVRAPACAPAGLEQAGLAVHTHVRH